MAEESHSILTTTSSVNAPPGTYIKIVGCEPLRVSSIRPSTPTQLALWREPWWSRAIAWGITGWYATGGRRS